MWGYDNSLSVAVVLLESSDNDRLGNPNQSLEALLFADPEQMKKAGVSFVIPHNDVQHLLFAFPQDQLDNEDVVAAYIEQWKKVRNANPTATIGFVLTNFEKKDGFNSLDDIRANTKIQQLLAAIQTDDNKVPIVVVNGQNGITSAIPLEPSQGGMAVQVSAAPTLDVSTTVTHGLSLSDHLVMATQAPRQTRTSVIRTTELPTESRAGTATSKPSFWNSPKGKNTAAATGIGMYSGAIFGLLLAGGLFCATGNIPVAALCLLFAVIAAAPGIAAVDHVQSQPPALTAAAS